VELMRQSKHGDNLRFYFMPGPAGMDTRENWCVCPYQPRPEGVTNFLRHGHCFWYLLPDGYTDQGPRVIVEAMAAGLPVIAENRDGAKDRVTSETGWLIDSHSQAIEIINSITPEILAEKGAAARRRAIKEFQSIKWFEAISGA
jgi:glycosyltransferase involved in cell wall biosynthesis